MMGTSASRSKPKLCGDLRQRHQPLRMAFSSVALMVWLPTCAASSVAGRRNLVWGLDLGNDNMVMAVAGRKGVDVVVNDVSGRQTPSAIYFAGDHRLIGEHSAGHGASNPVNLVNNIKYLLEGCEPMSLGVDGEVMAATAATAANQPNDAVHESGSGVSPPVMEKSSPFFCETRASEEGGRGGRLAVVRHVGEELELSASEAIAYLLGHCSEVVAKGAEGAGGVRETRMLSSSSCLVASVPSYLTLRQRQAVLDAAAIAGVTMPMVIDEGTAVALAYGLLKGNPRAVGAKTPLNVAFVDIGHSCAQVTVASFTSGGLKVLGRGCARESGTAACEAAVYDRVHSAMSEQGLHVTRRSRAHFRLAKAIAAVMKTLSANTEAWLSVDCIDGDKDFAITLTREEVESACDSFAGGISTACEEALRAARIGASDVANVELLGGGSFVPILRRAVERVFGAERLRRTMSSSESVATGCALAAAQHSSTLRLRPFAVTDCLSRSLRLVWRYQPRKPQAQNEDASQIKGETGAQAEDTQTGEIEIPAGTSIPWSTSVAVDTKVAEAGTMYAHMMEGADSVGSYRIDVSPPRGWTNESPGDVPGHGDAKLEVSLCVDVAGVPSVSSARLKFEEEVTEFVEVPAPSPKSPGSVPRAGGHESHTSEKARESEGEKARSEEGGEMSKSSPLGSEAPGRAAGDDLHGGGDGGGGGGYVAEGRDHSSGANGDGDVPASHDVEGAGSKHNGVAERGKEQGGRSKEQDLSSELATEGREGDEADLPRTDDSTGEPDEAGPSSSSSSSSSASSDRGTGSTTGRTENFAPEDGERSRPTKASASPQQRQRSTKVPRVVTRMRTWPLRVEQTYAGMLQGAGLEEARAQERALRAQDLAVKLAGEARNSLEDLIYATRARLEPGDGELSGFAKASEASAVLSMLADAEEWLYAPDDFRSKEAFNDRACGIKRQLSDIEARREARVRVVAALNEAEATVAAMENEIAANGSPLLLSERRSSTSELTSVRAFLSKTWYKLDAGVKTTAGGESLDYGSLVGRLPAQEGDVRKRMQDLEKALASMRKERS